MMIDFGYVWIWFGMNYYLYVYEYISVKEITLIILSYMEWIGWYKHVLDVNNIIMIWCCDIPHSYCGI